MHRICRVLLILCLAASSAHAADAPWTQGTYFQRDLGGEPVPVVTLLGEFSRAQGVPVLVSEDVQGTVSVQYPEMPPAEYLDILTRDNGLIWYFDGAAIHIYTSSELKSVVLPVRDITTEQLIGALQRLGVYSERFPITAEPEYGLLYVVGPARYIEIIQQISASARQRAIDQARIQVDIEVFPLEYAWADDQTFIIGDNQVLVPGVATLLRYVLGDDPGAIAGQQVYQIPYNLPSLQGLGLIRPENQALANAQQAAVNAQLAAREAQAQARATTDAQRALTDELIARPGDVPPETDLNAAMYVGESLSQRQAEQQLQSQVQTIIQPDPRTNSVVIRDVKERLDGYRRIIQQLDQPSGLVEVKATIIDLDATQGFQLGMPYHALWRNNNQDFALRANIETTDLADLTTNPGNFTVSLMDDQVTRFFLNLQALEQDGHARLVSKPSVVTINNIQAYLEEIEEFYVRVSGFEQVDLFNIKVGTKLYIIPHIINEPEGRRIKLNVRIEDGSRSDTAEVDEIPVVSRNIINTNAVLLEGQSLLIGGLIREEESKSVKGLPFLGRLPGVGGLFRETVRETNRFERLVLLTPTIIDLPPVTNLPHPAPGAAEPPPPVLPISPMSTVPRRPTDFNSEEEAGAARIRLR